MTKAELLEQIATWPDDELFFVIRGSNPAAPETLREYGRRVLHVERMSQVSVPSGSTKEAVRRITADRKQTARTDADAAFALADRMDALAPDWLVAAETAAGLRADTKNAELEAARDAEAAQREADSAGQLEIDEAIRKATEP